MELMTGCICITSIRSPAVSRLHSKTACQPDKCNVRGTTSAIQELEQAKALELLLIPDCVQ